ncbi:hypothetical protein Tco_0455037 [Tanacetum coccineum]
MRTRRSNYPNNSNVTIPRRQRKQVSNIDEPEIRTIVAPMAEHTMEELLRAPTEGYGEAIVLPEINVQLVGPVVGLYCRPSVAFVRKCLNEGWYTIHDENEILNTSESSNDNTNIVSAPQEPSVFNQDPGENSSQSLPQINHNCCYECGDSLDGIFCQQHTCKSCGKGAHYGYNCPPQILIISNPEPCYNQNLNEILQNFQSLQQQSFLGTCQQCGCNEYDGVCFHCIVGNRTQINFSTPYDSPNFANHPPQPQYETNICKLCGNGAHFGYDCSPQVPFVYNQNLCFDQNFDNTFPLTSPSFPQQNLCCENCGGPHVTFQCQPMNQDFYNSNLSGFDQYQPRSFPSIILLKRQEKKFCKLKKT